MIQVHVYPLSVVPDPPYPGIYAVLGPQDVVPWALKAFTIHFSPKPIVWVDAANKFNAHWVAMNARSIYLDTERVLRSYHVARPFTAYQLEAMVTQKVLPAARRYRAIFSVIADPLSLYEGAEGRDTQVDQSFKRFLGGLKTLSVQVPIVVLIPEPSPQRYVPDLLKIASWKRRLHESADGVELIEA